VKHSFVQEKTQSRKHIKILVGWDRVIVFNAMFNNISVISWRSVLLVMKPEYPVKTTNLTQVTDKSYQIMLFQVHFAMSRVLIAQVVLFWQSHCLSYDLKILTTPLVSSRLVYQSFKHFNFSIYTTNNRMSCCY
jgi:hypothetical protein